MSFAVNMTNGSSPEQNTATEQAPTTEGLTQEPQLEAKEPKVDALALMAKKEKALRQQTREIQEAKRAFEAEKATLKREIDELKGRFDKESVPAWKQKLLQNPLDALNEAGLSYDQLTNLILNGPNQGDIALQKLQAELQATKAETERLKSSMTDADKRQYEQAKSQIRAGVNRLVQADDSFEFIRAMEAQESVVSYIEEVYKTEGYVMDESEAAKEIEDYLSEQFDGWSKLKKAQARLNPAPKEATPEQKKAQPEAKTAAPATLSRQLTQTNSAALTNKQRRERAILRAQGIDPDSHQKLGA